MSLKDNKTFRWIIIPFCVALCFLGVFIPDNKIAISATNNLILGDTIHVLMIFLGSLILWLTIGIDWPSLLCLFSLCLVESFGYKNVFSNGFGSETFAFLLFTFICTYALSKTSIIQRITLYFINTKLAKKNGLWFSFLFLFAVLLVGLVMSPTVLFVIALPILKEIFNIAKIDKGEKIGKSLMMGLGFTVSISSGMTLIAHVFPVTALMNAKVEINQLSYMLFGIPIGLIVFMFMFLILFVFYKPNYQKLNNIDVTSLKEKLPKINKTEIITMITFAVVVLLWLLIDILKPSIPYFKSNFATALPPLLGAVILCIIRVDNKPIIKVDDAIKSVPWSSLIMCASTLALGAALNSDVIGIKAFLQNNLGDALNTLPPILLIIIFALWALLQTNVSSNIVTATVVATVAGTILSSTGVVDIKIMACIIGLLSSFAFATPPSMPHIALVGSSEYANTKDVLIYGGIIMIVSLIVAVGIGYPLGSLVLWG